MLKLACTAKKKKKSTFQRCIDYVDIAGRSSTSGRQSKYSGRKWRFSTSTPENTSISQTVSNTATVINHQQEVAYRLQNVAW